MFVRQKGSLSWVERTVNMTFDVVFSQTKGGLNRLVSRTKLWDPINVQYTNSLTPKVFFLMFVLFIFADGGGIRGTVDAKKHQR